MGSEKIVIPWQYKNLIAIFPQIYRVFQIMVIEKNVSFILANDWGNRVPNAFRM